VRRAVALPPAEAMRPEPPPVFRATLVERLGLQRWFSQPTRMILRSIERRPLKSLLTVLGIAMACGILMVGRFQEGAIDFLIGCSSTGGSAMTWVTFIEPTSGRACTNCAALPGVYRRRLPRGAGDPALRQPPAIARRCSGLEPEGQLHRCSTATAAGARCRPGAGADRPPGERDPARGRATW
jgi:putative ABC transport system permease protein